MAALANTKAFFTAERTEKYKADQVFPSVNHSHTNFSELKSPQVASSLIVI